MNMLSLPSVMLRNSEPMNDTSTALLLTVLEVVDVICESNDVCNDRDVTGVGLYSLRTAVT